MLLSVHSPNAAGRKASRRVALRFVIAFITELYRIYGDSAPYRDSKQERRRDQESVTADPTGKFRSVEAGYARANPCRGSRTSF